MNKKRPLAATAGSQHFGGRSTPLPLPLRARQPANSLLIDLLPAPRLLLLYFTELPLAVSQPARGSIARVQMRRGKNDGSWPGKRRKGA